MPRPSNDIETEITARPHDVEAEQTEKNGEDLVSDPLDYGNMNLKDAEISGYTDEKGRAVSKSKPEVEDSPTGALTDLGAGRSSVVKKH
jgi:hypothetical protein